MTPDAPETIVAVSSAVGAGGRMIVRGSGAGVIEIAERIGVPGGLGGGGAVRCELRFAGLATPAWIYLFRGPHSYSGEDSVEFHVPGNPVLAKMLLAELLRLGARQAEAGEFTARAYFNRRIDLTAAEGVAAAIAASNEHELSAARQLLAGELARRLQPVMDDLTRTLALVEVGIDFSDEDVSFLTGPEAAGRVADCGRRLGELLAEGARFERIGHEPTVVLAGRPNAGKSTLLNALAGRERAIVSPVAGTTRDALSAPVSLARGTVRLIDVAGIEPQERADARDSIDARMQRSAAERLRDADHVVLVRDCTDSRHAPPLQREPGLTVWSKADLALPSRCAGGVAVSAPHGIGMRELRDALDRLCFGNPSDARLALNLRHVSAIESARAALARAAEHTRDPSPELLATELREALHELGSVLGHVTPDDLLGEIFSAFCIGK